MHRTISVIEFEKKSKSSFVSSSDYKELQNLCMQEEFKDIVSCYNSKICFKNYAGIIQLKNGTFIEVLPKICLSQNEEKKSKNIFKKMIMTLKSDYYKSFSQTHIGTEDFPLLEVFISVFLKELDKLIQLGLRKNYIKIEENALFMKGKLKVSQNFKSAVATWQRM